MTGKLLSLDRALEPRCRRSSRCSTSPSKTRRWTGARPAPAAPADAGRAQAAAPAREPGAAAAAPHRGPALDRRRDPGVLDALVESLPTARLLLLVNYRPEYAARVGQQDLLPPAPAGPAAAGDRRRAPDGAARRRTPGLEPSERLLIARTEGNPFFLEESVRALVETKVLAGERGAYRLAGPIPTIEVPATVQAVLAARIDRLPPGGQAAPADGGGVGKDVPFALLAGDRGDARRSSLRRGLDAPPGRRVPLRGGLFPDLEYTFKHALTHEVAYGGPAAGAAPRAARRGSWRPSSALYPDRLGEHVERLAHHACGASSGRRRSDYLRQAGARHRAVGPPGSRRLASSRR